MKKEFEVGSYVFFVQYGNVHEGTVAGSSKHIDIEKLGKICSRTVRMYYTISGKFFCNNGSMRFFTDKLNPGSNDVFETREEAQKHLDHMNVKNFNSNIDTLHHSTQLFALIKKSNCSERQWALVKEISNLKKKINKYKKENK